MLGNTLKRLRGIYGYSAKEMSELLGISSSYLSEIENGKKKVSMDLLDRYSELFGLRVSTLVRFSEDYEDAELNNAGQKFITSLMSKVIEAYSNGK
ncbi:helix-turn-helix transcriptional regulator [Collinsella aerofaciens]|jgi:transcriptional regulator with XRE-family HTH domain|uniref:helix-turn-helix domain-containing protein n=1 Tax=Collinsella aerofaciens TaxID=74426 RepID=UPI00189C9E6B|nr:helix-turn-helix transcriptional regulator [Collinsella aerofaciens]MED9895016.1 helix-turn-helix transcriptional regulator [Collinsella sp.]MDB1886396.1 helix-turn-helix transcriptional regulator [Collinsella aerofaciens]MDB1890273.1 helix-turn-helix transcriptional regulator [Collinsella aerofaciens]MDB1892179.1 helix-turn-helix transcriptional regulator [Collinsella aerofaciens]MDB1894088.1 helix-turn-helix transcriptional regulator [Collinsella aerofaciens]